jgi:2-oxoglutarate ferredoxin oxidoreductase subunit alpha
MTVKMYEQIDSSVGLDPYINNFSITVGTVNGSGSQTSNLTILRALFKMGIPVSGKNLFPSNIQGLPTWYTIRVSKDGFLARRDEHEIVVAMNPETFTEDMKSLVPGGAFYYADDIKIPIDREDITTYPMPVKQ